MAKKVFFILYEPIVTPSGPIYDSVLVRVEIIAPDLRLTLCRFQVILVQKCPDLEIVHGNDIFSTLPPPLRAPKNSVGVKGYLKFTFSQVLDSN